METLHAPQIPADSSTAAIDAALEMLASRKTEWARLPVAQKIDLLERLKGRIDDAAGRWVTAASRAKGLPEGSSLRGEEWASGPWATVAYIDPLIRTLRHAADGTLGELVKGKTRQRPDGQTIVRVLPDGIYDHLLFSGMSVDVWQQPGVTQETLADTMAVFYKEQTPEGKVSLVLGAGNIASIPPLDTLYKLFAEGQVVLLKMNPVNSYLGPIFEDVFKDFVDAGYIRFAYGGVEIGKYLTRHDGIEEIHVTGSAQTHDAIVFGTGAEGEKRKAADEPEIDKRVTSELGGVSPCIVVPGDWSEPDLNYQAENVATQKTHNGGFNCIATQTLVLPEGWAQRDAFLSAVRSTLAGLPGREPYYPGAADRIDAAQAKLDADGGSATHTAVAEVDAGDEYAFQTEFFSNTLAVTDLPGGGADENPADWLDRAVDLANEQFMGTLGITILIHPKTLAAMGDRFQEAIARLKYGTIGVNVWSGVGFLIAQAAWGAFPGHDRNDIQSGAGTVHNAFLFDKPQKSVVQGPFAPFPRSLLLGELHTAPKPIWFVTNETAETTTRRLTSFAASPSPLKLPGIFAAALRG